MTHGEWDVFSQTAIMCDLQFRMFRFIDVMTVINVYFIYYYFMFNLFGLAVSEGWLGGGFGWKNIKIWRGIPFHLHNICIFVCTLWLFQ